MTTTPPHVRLTNVTKTFSRGRNGTQVVALDDVSFEVAKGEVFGVIGQSGAGKSTLIRLINGLESPTSGQVHVGDQEITALSERDRRGVRQDIGMIFQQFNLFRSRTVAGNVAYPLKVAGVDRAERDRRVARMLDFVGLLDRAHDHPEQLSGGRNSGSASPARWPPSRRCCSRTRRPARSTRVPPPRSWPCSAGSTASWA